MTKNIYYTFAGDPCHLINFRTSGTFSGKLVLTNCNGRNFHTATEDLSANPAPGCTFANNGEEAIMSFGSFGGTNQNPYRFFCIPHLCSGSKKYYCGSFDTTFSTGAFNYGITLTELPGADSHDNTCFTRLNTEALFMVKSLDSTIKF